MPDDQDKRGLEEALERARAQGDRVGQALGLLELGRYEALQGNSNTARSHYEAAFALCRQAKDRASAKLGLGDLERLFGDRSAARAHYESALELYRRGGDATGEAHALHSLGDLERLFGDRSAARAHYESSMALFHQGGDPMGEAHALHSLGDLERLFGDTAGARAHYETASQLYHQGGDRMGEARMLHSLGDLENRSANTSAARAHYEAARQLYHQGGDRMGEAHTLYSVGDLERLFGDSAAASQCYQAARGLYRQAGDRMGEARSLHGVAGLERLFDDPSGARAHYEAARELYRQAGDRAGEARAAYDLGDLDQQGGNTSAARAHFNSAMALYRQGGDRAGEAKAVHSLGDLERVSGDGPGARAHYEAARELYRQGGDRAGEAKATYDLGDLDHEAGNASEARSCYEVALDLYRRAGRPLGEAQSWYRLACLLREEGDLTKALAHALEAVRCLEHVRPGINNQSAARHGLAVGLHDIYSLALELAAQAVAKGSPGGGDFALELAESARSGSLAELLRAGGAPTGDEIGELLGNVIGLEATLVAEPSPPRGYVLTPEVLVRRNSGIEEALAGLRERLGHAVSSHFVRALCPGRPDVAGIRAALRANGVHALVYDLTSDQGGYRGHVVWAQPSGEVVAEALNIQGGSAQFLSAFLADVARGGGRGYWLPAHQAWADLARDLLPEALRAACLDAVSTGEPLGLVVVPDETCWALPFGALRLDTATPLLAGAVVQVVPTLGTYQALCDLGAPSRQVGGLAHLDPALDNEAEAEALEALQAPYGPVAWASEKQQLLELLGRQKGWYLLAFAVQVDNSPGLHQSLFLADGNSLSAGALLGLKLPRLVSLGSYGAGRRPPLGFALACLTQGTRSLLAPLFATDDPDTGAILSDAYRNLAACASPAEALRAAQLAYLAGHRYAPPAIWARLVAMGFS